MRTFAPIVAGVSDMNYRTFVIFNVIGGFIWAVGLTTLGYFLGQIDVVKNNIEIAIVAVIVLSLIPVAIEFLKHRREAKRAAEDALGRRHGVTSARVRSDVSARRRRCASRWCPAPGAR